MLGTMLCDVLFPGVRCHQYAQLTSCHLGAPIKAQCGLDGSLVFACTGPKAKEACCFGEGLPRNAKPRASELYLNASRIISRSSGTRAIGTPQDQAVRRAKKGTGTGAGASVGEIRRGVGRRYGVSPGSPR